MAGTRESALGHKCRPNTENLARKKIPLRVPPCPWRLSTVEKEAKVLVNGLPIPSLQTQMSQKILPRLLRHLYFLIAHPTLAQATTGLLMLSWIKLLLEPMLALILQVRTRRWTLQQTDALSHSLGRTNTSGSGGDTRTGSVPNADTSSHSRNNVDTSSCSRTNADNVDPHDENEPPQLSTTRKRKGRQNRKPRKKNRTVLDEGWARDLEDAGRVFAHAIHIFPSFLDIAVLALKTINALASASEEDLDPEDFLEEDKLSIFLLMLIQH